jgi:hypothetical protein
VSLCQAHPSVHIQLVLKVEDEGIDADLVVLANAMSASNCLLDDCRIPVLRVKDNPRTELEIQTCSACYPLDYESN